MVFIYLFMDTSFGNRANLTITTSVTNLGYYGVFMPKITPLKI